MVARNGRREDTGRVLIVDDDADCRELFDIMLRAQGFVPTTVGSAEEALAKVAEETFSLVILDIWLPGLSGDQALEQIRSRSQSPGIPVVAVTAHALPQEIVRLEGLAFDAVLSKPVDYDRLRHVVGDLTRSGDS